MTVAAPAPAPSYYEHIVLEDVSWEFYECLLQEIGDGATRVTYDDRRMEIMSPLPKHELWSDWIGRLVQTMCLERKIRLAGLGSTTFRDKRKQKGLEPDKCFYVQRFDDVRDMEDEFDPTIHPAPDLAIEIDMTHRSVSREPIYAALGVPELWRFDNSGFHVLHLSPMGAYVEATASLAFPFLPIARFAEFVLRRREQDQIKVLYEFRDWVKSLS